MQNVFFENRGAVRLQDQSLQQFPSLEGVEKLLPLILRVPVRPLVEIRPVLAEDLLDLFESLSPGIVMVRLGDPRPVSNNFLRLRFSGAGDEEHGKGEKNFHLRQVRTFYF